MKRIGIIPKRNKPEALRWAAELAGWSMERGMEVYVEEPVASMSSGTIPISPEEMAQAVDLVIVLGGDGTLLSVARLVLDKGVPILGVNLGGLGFLTEISLKELYPVMERVLAGDFETESRMTLRAELLRGEETVIHMAVLNDAAINSGAFARLIQMETFVDGKFLSSFRADGLILCTPTGSTAYNLAAGGPIIHPTLNCIGIVPICPHTLTNRPLLVPDTSIVEVILNTKGEGIRFTLDGQVGVAMEVGDMVRVQKGSNCVHLVKNPVRNYFNVLREKLHWGER